MSLYKTHKVLPCTLVATTLLIAPVESPRQLKWHPEAWGETKTLSSLGENIYQFRLLVGG